MNDDRKKAIQEAASEAGASTVAVAYRDLETGESGGIEEDRWFHAASTMKLGVLLALFDASERDAVRDRARLHVRNQFTSLADGRYFRVSSSRDGNQDVHSYVGRTMRIRDLARHMIVTSSNLATNVLVEFLGPAAIQASLSRHGIEGFEVRRGVEDERAWEAGINNRVTAAGLADLLELVAGEEAVSKAASRAMLEILHDQEYVSGIPAGAPDTARVANKTGEISTVVHDAGIVYLGDRRPYVLVVLTEWSDSGETGARRQLIASVSSMLLGDLKEASHG